MMTRPWTPEEQTFFLPMLSNRAKFFRVNRARFIGGSLSLSSPSLSICRSRSRVAGEACSCPSTMDAGGEVSGRVGVLGFGARRVGCASSSISAVSARAKTGYRTLLRVAVYAPLSLALDVSPVETNCGSPVRPATSLRGLEGFPTRATSAPWLVNSTSHDGEPAGGTDM